MWCGWFGQEPFMFLMCKSKAQCEVHVSNCRVSTQLVAVQTFTLDIYIYIYVTVVKK